MAILLVPIDMSKPPGERLAPELAAELAIIAPSQVLNNSLTTAKMRDRIVTEPKLALGAVTSPIIAAGGVKATNIEAGAVGNSALANGSVTDVKSGAGVVTAHNDDGDAITLDVVPIASADWDALAEKDPNTLYAVY